MKPRSPTRKNSFLLIEVLISLALVLLLFFPLLRPHFVIQKETQTHLKELQLKRLSREAYLSVKQKLYEGEIPFDVLLSTKGTGEMALANKAIVHLERNKTCSYNRSFRLKKSKTHKKKKTPDCYVLLDVETIFSNGKERFSFPHTLLVARTIERPKR